MKDDLKALDNMQVIKRHVYNNYLIEIDTYYIHIKPFSPSKCLLKGMERQVWKGA